MSGWTGRSSAPEVVGQAGGAELPAAAPHRRHHLRADLPPEQPEHLPAVDRMAEGERLRLERLGEGVEVDGAPLQPGPGVGVGVGGVDPAEEARRAGRGAARTGRTPRRGWRSSPRRSRTSPPGSSGPASGHLRRGALDGRLEQGGDVVAVEVARPAPPAGPPTSAATASTATTALAMDTGSMSVRTVPSSCSAAQLARPGPCGAPRGRGSRAPGPSPPAPGRPAAVGPGGGDRARRSGRSTSCRRHTRALSSAMALDRPSSITAAASSSTAARKRASLPGK